MYSIVNWQPLISLPSDYDDQFLIAKINGNKMQAMYTATLGVLKDTNDIYIKVPLVDVGIPYDVINSISLNSDGEGMVWSPIPDNIYSKH